MKGKFFSRLGASLDRTISDERQAARIRLWFAIAFTLLLTWVGYMVFENVDTRALAQQSWRHSSWIRFNNPLLSLLYIPFWQFLFFLQYALRHAIIPVAVLVGAVLASASYIQDIYELPSFRLAFRYALASIFGIGYPHLSIDDGKKVIPKNKINLVDRIGGPGYVHINPGNVVLFESLRSPSSVKGAGIHFVSRFDTIKEIVSLDDQHGFIEKLGVTTKDGIDVFVRDIHYRYRLRTGRQFGDYADRRRDNPYPYSVKAVRDMAYNRAVRRDGLSSWHLSLQLAVDSGITDYIKAHTFDHLTAPTSQEDDPRPQIARALMGKGIRQRLRRQGAELLWFDIGHFDVSDHTVEDWALLEELRPVSLKDVVATQRVDTWGAKWVGNAQVVRSHGEARRLAVQELGRAEGQAEMLKSIIQALETADQAYGPLEGDRLRAILLTRTAQVLDAMADKERKRKASRSLPPSTDRQA